MIRIALAFSLLAWPAFAQSVFTSLPAAQAHCPQDTVVWLNATRHIYRLPDQKGYGRGKHGMYACQKEANAAGDRAKKVKNPANAGAEPDTAK